MAKTSPEYRKKMSEMYEEDSYRSTLQNRSRARSITSGPAGGGSIEISMRGDFGNMWIPLRPTEIVEFLEQLASSIGVEIAMRPKQNFTSWRSWHDDEHGSPYWKGSADWEMESQKEQKLFREVELKVELEKRKQMLALQAEHEIKQLSSELSEKQNQLEPSAEQENSEKVGETQPKPKRRGRTQS